MDNELNSCIEKVRGLPNYASAPGFPEQDYASALCFAIMADDSYNPEVGITANMLAKVQTSRWPYVGKAVFGGMKHLVSVDNGGNYAELWHSGENWYAVTGRENKVWGEGIHQVEGIRRGATAHRATITFIRRAFRKTRRGGCGNC